MKLLIISYFILGIAFTSFSQGRVLPKDTAIVTKHNVTINGNRISYTATVGTQPVWDANSNAVASLHYTYYTRDNITDTTERPIVFSFNGGPGSASVWMHLAYTGPKTIKINDEGFPIQPYGVKENPYSILDIADIVFINPVNTGYSRTIPESGDAVNRDYFFGVNADIKYLAEWMTTFVTRNNRWRSPKYLIGESYGTTRVSGLALELQNNQWMYLNGVVLVSPTDLGIERNGPVEIANRLPYFAATAWYHKVLPAELQNKSLENLLPEVESYTMNTLLPVIARGASINEQERVAAAKKMSYYSGISEDVYIDTNLDLSINHFWKELLRDNGFTVGRLDSRYLGIDEKNAGIKPDYNSELTTWLHAFTPAINYYLQEELNFKTDLKYYMFGPVHPWDRTENTTGKNLRQAMAQNPYLQVLTQSGYFDGATTYFNAKYNHWQLDPSGKMNSRIHFKGYESGHMMYLRRDDLEKANNDLRDFINSTLTKGKPAKYSIEN